MQIKREYKPNKENYILRLDFATPFDYDFDKNRSLRRLVIDSGHEIGVCEHPKLTGFAKSDKSTSVRFDYDFDVSRDDVLRVGHYLLESKKWNLDTITESDFVGFKIEENHHAVHKPITFEDRQKWVPRSR